VSARKTPDVRGLLLEGHFARSGELPHSDPLAITQMLLEVERIQPYERNPRTGQNPRYAEIKASVRALGGLNNPLTVTRRPGEDDYRVEAGGNTRLQVLKELWAETADERFRCIHCLFVPWRSESHVLGAHLIENELRGDLMFIEKAKAIRDLQAQLEQETGAPLSRSALQRALGEIGYSVSRRQLIRYHYALERLEPLIPRALQAGLGRQQVDQLRDLETAYQTFSAAGLNDPAAFDRWFRGALSELDCETLEVNQVRTALDASFAKLTGQSVAQIQHARQRSVESSTGTLSAESGTDGHLDKEDSAVDQAGASHTQSAANPEQADAAQASGISGPMASGGSSSPPALASARNSALNSRHPDTERKTEGPKERSEERQEEPPVDRPGNPASGLELERKLV
jgi:ParB family protein of integrating conjugative element (PFGI_1 class)